MLDRLTTGILQVMVVTTFIGFVYTSCVKPPPTLGPVAAADFQKTRVIKGLDLLRDFAVDGEAAKPQVVSTDLARKVVTYHKAALQILDAAGSDWRTIAGTSLDAFDATLSQTEQQKLAPYVALVHSILIEVP
jgi:hypothetical protein